MARSFIEIDDDLHYRLKLLAVAKKETMRSMVITALLTKYPELQVKEPVEVGE